MRNNNYLIRGKGKNYFLDKCKIISRVMFESTKTIETKKYTL